MGVPVMVNELLAILLFVELLKKAAAPEPSSFFAEITMVTPWAGRVDVIETVRGKSTCGAAGCTELTGGVSVTAKFASVGGGGGGGGEDFFLQLPVMINRMAIPAKTQTTDFLISKNLIEK